MYIESVVWGGDRWGTFVLTMKGSYTDPMWCHHSEPILLGIPPHTSGLSLEEVGGSGTEIGEALGRYDHGSRCDVE